MKHLGVLRPVPHWRIKLPVTGVCLLALAVLTARGVPCLFRLLLHIQCPGCGMTRALSALLHGDLARSLRYNCMLWTVPVCYWFILYDGRPFRHPALNWTILGAAGAGLLTLFILRLCGILTVP